MWAETHYVHYMEYCSSEADSLWPPAVYHDPWLFYSASCDWCLMGKWTTWWYTFMTSKIEGDASLIKQTLLSVWQWDPILIGSLCLVFCLVLCIYYQPKCLLVIGFSNCFGPVKNDNYSWSICRIIIPLVSYKKPLNVALGFSSCHFQGLILQSVFHQQQYLYKAYGRITCLDGKCQIPVPKSHAQPHISTIKLIKLTPPRGSK
jgi:hypothetical protein